MDLEYERGRLGRVDGSKVIAQILLRTREAESIWANLHQVKPCVYHATLQLHHGLSSMFQDTDDETVFVITNVIEAEEGLEGVLYGYHMQVEFEPQQSCSFC